MLPWLAPTIARALRLTLVTGVGLGVALGVRPAVDAAGSRAREAGVEVGKEYALKAAFVFNFLRYTTWPEGAFESPEAPLVLGIAGRDPFGKTIESVLKDKRIGERAIVIQRFPDPEAVDSVHALFLGAMADRDRAALYAALSDQAVLTIGDAFGMAGRDTCVSSFYLKSDRVRFEVSTKAAERADLTISSQLLKLADIVERRRRP